MLTVNIFIYIASFIAIWYGSGLIIQAVGKFSSHLKLSPFVFSFAFLGILTSIPELSVGMQAVANHDAEIFVGNLLGGIAVIFLLIIPSLAVFGNGISLKNELSSKLLLATIGVILAPFLLILDKKVTNFEGVLLVILYLILLFLIQRKNGIFDRDNQQLLNIKAYSYTDIFRVILGFIIVFTASSLIVDKTMYFADVLQIEAFYIGLIIIAIGTDLPELTISIRSVISEKKQLAMGDYIGAAAVSTFLFGLFTLLHNGEVLTISNFLTTFLFIAFALGLFFYFSHFKKYISRSNGLFMMFVYVLFVVFEVVI